jgi:3-deoxy-manno-octulosonate cytidylyltransferase (CMP-KDO synthetase)
MWLIKMPTNTFKVVIPARYASSRFPGKVLADIKGWPMIQHVYQRAVASGADEVIIATDDERVADAAKKFGAPCRMTSPTHASGSDRIAEIAAAARWQDTDIVVNVQGDEPLIPPENIAQVAHNLAQHGVEMATLRTPIREAAEVRDPNVVKVVVDRDDIALYFSRAAIPHRRDPAERQEAPYYRHIGLYAYRVGFLRRYTQTPPVLIEETEKLEQLRALWLGVRIHTAVARLEPGPGIDTMDELGRLLANWQD